MARNLRVGHDEIDLLVRVDGRRVAVEVKTRIGADAVCSVTTEQTRRLRRALASLQPPADRGDVIAVRLDASGATVSWRRAVA